MAEMDPNAHVGVATVRPGFRHTLMAVPLAAITALGLLLVVPIPVSADCAVGDAGCVQMEQTSGSPGTKASLSGFGGAGCGEAPGFIDFVAGDYDGDASYPTARLEVSAVGETVVATFVVPAITPGVYRLHLRCDAGIVYGASPFLPGTFTVAGPPDTDTAPSDPRPILVLAAVAGFVAALVRQRAPARRP